MYNGCPLILADRPGLEAASGTCAIATAWIVDLFCGSAAKACLTRPTVDLDFHVQDGRPREPGMAGASVPFAV